MLNNAEESLIDAIKYYLQIYGLSVQEFADYTSNTKETIENLLEADFDNVSLFDYIKILDKLGFKDRIYTVFPRDL